ncbi:MAG TPA: arylesterase [Plasticicumulans sp.]|uniref:arylesterase n=1 Tax=Plasticicumulans sp. TaxID=2307179 RepID=UPI002B7E50B8|nr:arylesterase [Plasticicumulans sp.]HMZ10245.1 arylesterase [Plasticicumulans sp.]HNG51291.1 arylesterase [Plasticicumulans sp.]HNI24210.1 arylesterase [Plasticicumulans sp.]
MTVLLRFLLSACAALSLSVLAPLPARAIPGSPVILVLGDSLSAAYGMPIERGWVALLAARYAAAAPTPPRIVNASISGETTRGGLERLPALLAAHRPELVVLELGANDGLRGLPVADLEANLARMIELSQQAGARVLLLGMRIPPNYGPRYTERFHASYAGLAARYDVPLVPFFLDGVAGDPALVQDDGLHPRAEAQPRMLENIWPALDTLLHRPR